MERKLTAILCADVFGYSRLMGENEEATLRTLTSHRKIIDSSIGQHHGRFVNSAGDSVLAEFASVVNAVQSAVDIQVALKAENANLPTERRMDFRIGVNLGDVMVEGEQIYGDGVNVAARLESLAEPGGICISGIVHDQVSTKLALSYADLGEQAVKNIAKPVRVFRVLPEGTVAPRETRRIRRRYWRSGVLSLTGLAIIAGTIVLVQNLSLRLPHTHASIPPQEKPNLPSIPSIAVLPFTNLSGDPQQEYFSDGITDQLINYLSRVPGLFVIARDSSFSYKGKASKEQEIGRDLGVKYVLEGSVRKATDRVRIGVELVDASSDTEMWTQNYDRPLKDIFAMQDEIVAKVVTTLGLILELQKFPGRPPTSHRPQNLPAFDDYLRALGYVWRLTPAGLVKAREWAEQAIKSDPTYADAYALIGGSYTVAVLFRYSTDPRADLNRAGQAAEKTLALDDSNSNGLTLVCTIDYLAKRFDEAVAACQRAIAIDPNYAGAYVELSSALVAADRPQEAVRAVESAIRLDPNRRDFYVYFIASPYQEMGRYQESIPLLQRHVAAYPDNIWAHVLLVVAYVEVGREKDALAEAAEVKRMNPNFTYADFTGDPTMNKHVRNDLRKAGLK